MSSDGGLSARDRLEILELYARYTHTFDEGRAEQLGELFTADGQFTRPGADPIRGRAALEAMVRAAAARGTGNRHLVSAVVIEPPPDDGPGRAIGRAYVQVVGGAGRFDPVAFGRYEDEFHHDGGRWRIRSRSFIPFPPPPGT